MQDKYINTFMLVKIKAIHNCMETLLTLDSELGLLLVLTMPQEGSGIATSSTEACWVLSTHHYPSWWQKACPDHHSSMER